MLKRDWRQLASYVGAGLIILATVAGPFLAAANEDQKHRAERAAEANKRQREAISAFVFDKDEKAIRDEQREQRGEERERSDLGAQWATAVWTFAQALFGFFGLVGLFFTVFYARKAWEAAKDSADADNKALELTRTQLDEARANTIEERKRTDAEAATQQTRFDAQLAEAKRAADAARDAATASKETADNASFIGMNQSRAYVHVVSARLDYTGKKTLIGEEFEPNVYITVANVGVTPTKYVAYSVVGAAENWDVCYDGYREVRHGAVHETRNLAPKDTSEIKIYVSEIEKHVAAAESARGTPWSRDTPRYFSIRGRLIYRDVFDRAHFTDFGFYVGPFMPGSSDPMEAMTDGFARYESYPPRKPSTEGQITKAEKD